MRMELVELVTGILFYFFRAFVAGNVLVIVAGQVIVIVAGFWFQSVVGSLSFCIVFFHPSLLLNPHCPSFLN